MGKAPGKSDNRVTPAQPAAPIYRSVVSTRTDVSGRSSQSEAGRLNDAVKG
jgi:hypothetical protein